MYKDESFDYAIYLQQVLCFIPNQEDFENSLKESFRVMKSNGIVVFSFLDFDSRLYNSALNFVVNSLRILRGEIKKRNHLPWLKINNKFNYKLLFKNQPTNYWVKKDEIILHLESVGFEILEAKNTNQLYNNSTIRNGMLYVVCKKK